MGGLGALWLALRTPDIDPASAEARHALAASRFVEDGAGLRIHVRDEGPDDPARRGGTPLLLVHGATASLHGWSPWVDRLRHEHRLVSLDLPGHGLTGPHPRGCASLACMADAVALVRRELGLERVVLVGHSLGGQVAIAHALARPAGVEGLVLVAAAGAPVQAAELPDGLRIAANPVAARLAESVTPRWLVERSLRQSATVDEAVATPEQVDRHWELLRREGNRRATLQRMAQPRRPFDERQLRALGARPVLLIWGEDDRLTPPQAGRWYQEHFARARLEILPATGHLPQEERPDATAALVSAWLQALPAAQPAR